MQPWTSRGPFDKIDHERRVSLAPTGSAPCCHAKRHPAPCGCLAHSTLWRLADVLISSSKPFNDGLVMPTRVHVAPDRFQGMLWKPAGLRRKVIEISSDCVALWAGNFQAAYSLAERARDWFRNTPVTEEDMVAFLEAHYRRPIPNFFALIASTAHWFYKLGNVYQSESAFAGVYAVAGTGADIFRSTVDRMLPSEQGKTEADVDGLRLASDLMAREIVTGDTIAARFGGSYKVLFNGPTGIERVDDVLHVFAAAEVCPNTIEISHYPHATRQWYRGNSTVHCILLDPGDSSARTRNHDLRHPKCTGRITPAVAQPHKSYHETALYVCTPRFSNRW